MWSTILHPIQEYATFGSGKLTGGRGNIDTPPPLWLPVSLKVPLRIGLTLCAYMGEGEDVHLPGELFLIAPEPLRILP